MVITLRRVAFKRSKLRHKSRIPRLAVAFIEDGCKNKATETRLFKVFDKAGVQLFCRTLIRLTMKETTLAGVEYSMLTYAGQVTIKEALELCREAVQVYYRVKATKYILKGI